METAVASESEIGCVDGSSGFFDYRNPMLRGYGPRMKINSARFSTVAAPEQRFSDSISVSLATDADREQIYRARHEVYARELGQHPPNADARLRDPLDDGNLYLVARIAGELAGFISVTPPGVPAYSIDKYFSRDTLPFPVDDGLYEIRLLTVLKAHRGSELATLLMYAAFRWVESHGGRHIVAIGRREILDLYLRVGLQSMGKFTRCGSVTFDLLHATVADDSRAAGRVQRAVCATGRQDGLATDLRVQQTGRVFSRRRFLLRDRRRASTPWSERIQSSTPTCWTRGFRPRRG